MPGRRSLALLVSLLALGLGAATVRAQQDPEEEPHPEADPRLRLDLDPTGPAHDLVRAQKLLETGRTNDGIALLDRIAHDPRAREGLVARNSELKLRTRILASFDTELRLALLSLKPDAREAYEALHQGDAQRLLDLGPLTDELGSLRELIARYPATVEAAQAALLLGERELEQGEGDDAAAHLELAADDLKAGLTPAELDRARKLLPAALALAGRTGEAEQAFGRLPVGLRPVAKAALELAEREAESATTDSPGHKPGALEWAHDTLDYYEDPKLPPVPVSEPVLDATRLYVHDGSHALALALTTGAVEWQTGLDPGDDAYRRPAGACRLALGARVVACALPQGTVVVLDRDSGAILFRLVATDLEKLAGLEDHDFTINSSLAVSGDTLVLAVTTHHTDDELVLIGLDARTGAFRWRTGILSETADPDAPEPTLAAGPDAIYLASGRGVVATLEAVSGSILWLRRYDSFRDATRIDPRLARFGRRIVPGLQPPLGDEGVEKPRAVSPPQFVGLLHGLVVAAPADSKHVYAFSPRTGEDVWSQGDDTLGPDRKPIPWTVLGPCRTGVLVLLDTGTIKLMERHERVVAKLPGAKLAGRAAVSGSALLLPLEGGLDRIDLESGAVELLLPWTDMRGLTANVVASGPHVIAVTPAQALAFGGEEAAIAPVGSLTAPQAVHALGDPRFHVREQAQAQLLELGLEAKDELTVASGSRDPERRIRARFILDELARRDRLAAWTPRVPPEWLDKDKDLLLKLTHRNPEVRLETLRALSQFGDAVLPLFKDLLADADPRVASNAAMALLEHKDRSGIELVRRALASPKVEDRIAAGLCLQQRGASEDLPAIVAATQDPEPRVRAIAIVAALAIGKEKSIPLAIAALDDKDAGVRSILANELLAREIPPPPHDREALDVLAPVLRKLVHDPQRAIREQVIREGLTERPPPEPSPDPAAPGVPVVPGPPPKASGWIPRSHPAVFEALGEGLNDTDPTVRDLANYVLINAREEDVHLMPRESLERALAQPGRDDLGRLHLLQIAETILDRGEPFAADPLARTALETKSTKVLARSLDDLEKSRKLAPLGPADLASVASLTLPGNDVKLRTVGYETLVNGKGPGRGRLLLLGLEDPDENLRTFVREQLGALGDADILHELLRREVLAPKPADQASAAAVLDARAGDSMDTLGPMLIVALSEPEANVRATAWRRLRALARREADLGMFDPGGTPEERAPGVQRAARWWWEHTGHDRAPETLLQGLTDEASAKRWKYAKKLGDLGVPELRPIASEAVRDGLANAAAAEVDDYVTKQIVASLGRILGRDLGWKDGQSAAEKARVLKAAKEWRTLH